MAFIIQRRHPLANRVIEHVVQMECEMRQNLRENLKLRLSP